MEGGGAHQVLGLGRRQGQDGGRRGSSSTGTREEAGAGWREEGWSSGTGTREDRREEGQSSEPGLGRIRGRTEGWRVIRKRL